MLLLAYPLHPAGKPAKLRDAHLPRIATPVLCFNGTRDPLCEPALMDAVVARLASNWTMHWLDGADHSFPCEKRRAAMMRPCWTKSELERPRGSRDHESAGCGPSYPSTIFRSPIDAPLRIAIAPAYSADR